MTTGAFPNNPGNRRVILVLDDHDIERCQYEEGGSELLDNREVYVLPLSQQDDARATLPKSVISGSTLIQSPFDTDVYVEAMDAPQRFALAKHMHFSTLCMHLGAKEVVIEQIELITRSGKAALEVKGGKPGAVEGNASMENEELEKFSSSMHLHDEFEGGSINIEAAEKLLQRTGLFSDPNMYALIEMRRDGVNQIRNRKLALNLSNEAKSNLKIAARIKSALVKVSADYEYQANAEQEYKLTVTVKF